MFIIMIIENNLYLFFMINQPKDRSDKLVLGDFPNCDIPSLLEEVIQNINRLLERKDESQKRLKLSQVREIQNDIRFLIERWMVIFKSASSEEEKLWVIELVLKSVDYFKKSFSHSGFGTISSRIDESYVKKLLGYFKNKGAR